MMKKNLIVIFLFLISLIISSCGKTSTTRTFKLSLGKIVATPLDGGSILQAVNAQTGQVLLIDMTQKPYEADIPNGVWNFYIVGYVGPDLWSGNTYCGTDQAKSLNGGVVDIIVNASQASCANEPYVSMIAKKKNVWDSALWDAGKWGP